jgi:spermidine dehydrogenase
MVGMGGIISGCTDYGIENESNQRAPRPSTSPDWYGYGGVGDFRDSHGNTPDAVANAHRLRDREFPQTFDQLASVEEYDFVVVGCGIAGLSAGLEFVNTRKDDQTCLMLDNHPVFGGEAKENEFNVNGQRLVGPQGANGFFIPEDVDDPNTATGDPRYYAELDLPREYRQRSWSDDHKPLGFSGDNYEYLVKGLQERSSVGHFFPGDGGIDRVWAIDMWQRRLENTPFSESQRATLLKWYHTGATRSYSSDQEAIAALDTMSYKEFLEKELGIGKDAAAYADLFLASAGGLGSDATSAYAAYKSPVPGFMDMPPPGIRRTSFPGGNSGFARHFLKRLIPDGIYGPRNFENIINGRINFAALDKVGQPVRMRLNSTVLSVSHDGPAQSAGGVNIIYVRDNRFYGIRAKGVVMATGSWINRHVVRDAPESIATALKSFRHAPFLVANVALTNWRFLYKLGVTAAIWNKSENHFGYTCNIRNPMQVGDYQPPLNPDEPTILSFYTPFFYPGLPIDAQVVTGRAELLGTSYPDYENKILRQLMSLFGSSGFDPAGDVAGIILNRWGHAYSVPYPGFYGGKTGVAPRDVLRKGYGRVAFGHSELDGLQHYGPAADEGRRAFKQIADAA